MMAMAAEMGMRAVTAPDNMLRTQRQSLRPRSLRLQSLRPQSLRRPLSQLGC